MNKTLSLLFTLMCVGLCWAQDTQLSATFNSAAYYLPDKQQAYLETQLSIDAWTCRFVPAEGGYHATIEALLVVRDGDSAIYAKRYMLNSPIIADSAATNFNFLDIQRFSMPMGIYKIELTLRDQNSNNASETATQSVLINFDKKKPSMSEIQLMASVVKTTTPNILSRGGYDMEPYCNDFIPEEVERLDFYYEVYNIQEEVGKKGFVTYAYIEEATTGKRVIEGGVVQRSEATPLVARCNSIDISQLPTGNYQLVVEVRDSKNDLLMYKRLNFFRSNAKDMVPVQGEVKDGEMNFMYRYNDEEQLRTYLDALYPIASSREMDQINALLRRNNLQEKQVFLFTFWQQRDAEHAEQLWEEYRERIDYVEENFSYPRTPGHRTDRGRVYLQYGPPDFVRDEKNFVSALYLGSGNGKMGEQQKSLGHVYYLPYQFWRYNKLDGDDANRVFLFWDELRSTQYKLLVSNARGETWDPLWERRLSKNQLEEYVVGEVGEQFNRGY